MLSTEAAVSTMDAIGIMEAELPPIVYAYQYWDNYTQLTPVCEDLYTFYGFQDIYKVRKVCQTE